MHRLIAVVPFVVTACADPAPPPPAPPAQAPIPIDGTWRLQELEGVAVGPKARLTLDADGVVSGAAPCNRYFGRYRTTAGLGIAFEGIGATRRACPDLAIENAYLGALDKAAAYRVAREGGELALLDAAGGTVARFLADPQTAGLTGDWRVASVAGGPPGPVPPGVRLAFGTDGRLTGNLGCNDVFGPYEVEGERLSFGPIALTARACFAPAPFEGPVADALPRTRRYRTAAGGVELLDEAGTVLLRLARP